MLNHAKKHENNKTALKHRPPLTGCFVELCLQYDTKDRMYQWYGARNGRWSPFGEKFKLRNRIKA